jgi:hypothetical protein
VPNAIDGDTSTTSQVVSVRSGTCRRTCGSPVCGGRWDGLENVVAHLVRPQLRDLGAGAHSGAKAVARQRPAHAARHHQVERLHEALWHRSRALPGLGLDEVRLRQAATVRWR